MRLSKVELKKQLQVLGIKVEGNFVKKVDVEKIVAQKSKYTDGLKAAISALNTWDTKYYPVYADASNNLNEITNEDHKLLEKIDGTFKDYLGIDRD